MKTTTRLAATKLLLVSILLTTIACGCSSRVAVETATATRGTIREFVDERAITRLPRTYLITMPYNGRIEPIKFVEGQGVEKDKDVVAQIVEVDLDLAVAEAQAVVDRLKAASLQPTWRKGVSVDRQRFLRLKTEDFTRRRPLTLIFQRLRMGWEISLKQSVL